MYWFLRLNFSPAPSDFGDLTSSNAQTHVLSLSKDSPASIFPRFPPTLSQSVGSVLIPLVALAPCDP